MAYLQPGICSVLDFGIVPNKSDHTTSENNAAASESTIDAAQAYCASSPPGGVAIRRKACETRSACGVGVLVAAEIFLAIQFVQ
jgi:hypothetical protein